MSSFLSLATNAIAGKLIGGAISTGAKYLFNELPTGAQSFLSDIGDFFDIDREDIGRAAGELASAAIQGPSDMKQQMFRPQGLRSTETSLAAGRMDRAGTAQMIPLGSTDRVSRAIQDARVTEKLLRMAGSAPIPVPNISRRQTISLQSAAMPRTSLAKKFSK